MIQLQNVTLHRGKKTLLSDASLTLYSGEKVGIVGANGAGKTSLFLLLQNEISPEEGVILLPEGLTTAHIKQEMPSGEVTSLDYTLKGHQQYTILQEKLQQAEKAGDGIAIANLHQKMGEIDAYSLPSKAAKILTGLGFSQEELKKPVKDFSGGWRMRLNLAQVLIAQADVLLLDEPTNHLDLETIVWLEEWLQQSNQTILIISHDREFLDKVINRTIYLNEKKLTSYSGNYSLFEKLRAQQLTLQQATYEKQERQRAHLQKFVDRFKAKASKAKQAQSRVKMLEKIEWVSQVQKESPFRFEFKPTQKAGDPMLRLIHVDAGYTDNPVLKNISCDVREQDRIGLIGPNGAGKSTLIKLLAGKLLAQQGEVTKNNKIKIGYFAQHQLEQLDGEEGCLKHLQRVDPTVLESQARQYLGGFNFQGDTVFEPVKNFSGGEKARLVLALLIWQAPNLILLDEPTNHLDIEMREALNLALQQYAGAMILVSHDRFLLNSVTDQLWLVADGKVSNFDGDLTDYRNWFHARMQASAKSKEVKKPKTKSPKNQSKLNSELKKLEKKLETSEKALQTIDIELTDSSLYDISNKALLEEMLLKREALSKEKALLEEKILFVIDALE